MKFIYRYLIYIVLLVSYQGRAQIGLKLGTSPGTLNSGAIMDLSGASNRGFLLPRVSLPTTLTTFGLNGQPDVGSNGMMVYNTNTNTPGGVGYYVWSGTTALNTGGAWSRILTGSTILAPNVSLTGTSAPAGTSTGQLIYNTATGISGVPVGLAVWNGSSWVSLLTSNLYTASGTLTGDRTVTQGTNTLAFTSSATIGTSHFTVDGTTLNVDAVNNRVGIGTASPARVLHTFGDAVRFDRFGGAPGSTTTLMPQALFVNTNGSKVYKTWSAGMANSTMDFIISDFDTLVAATLGTQRLVISGENGNVGIGTSIPTAKLHVTGGSVLLGVNDAVQNVHIVGQGTPANYTTAPSAALDVSSLNKGFLPPRMTYTQILAIPNPADGLIVYCIDCNPKAPVFFNGVEWSSYDGKIAPKLLTGQNPVIELQTVNPLNTSNLVFTVTNFGSWDGLQTDGTVSADDFTYEWYRVRGTTTTLITSANLLNSQDPNTSSITVAGSPVFSHQTGDKYYCRLKTKTFIPVSVNSNEEVVDFSALAVTLKAGTTALQIQGAGNFFEVTRDYTTGDYDGANPFLAKTWEYQDINSNWVTITTSSVPGFTSSTDGGNNVNIPPVASGSFSLIGRQIRYKIVASNSYNSTPVTSVSNSVAYGYLLDSQLFTTNRLSGTSTLAQNIYVALSVRRLNTNYTGPALRIYNATGSTFADINFTASGDLDETAITNFMTTNNSSAFVGIWYDQSGNNRHAYAEEIALAPIIGVRSGGTNTLRRYGTANRPAISLDGTGDIMYIKASSATALTNSTTSPRLVFNGILPANTNTSPFPGTQLLFVSRINNLVTDAKRNGGVISGAPRGNASSIDHFGRTTSAGEWLPLFFTSSRVSLPLISPQTNYVGSYTLTSQNGVTGNITARLNGNFHGEGLNTISYAPNTSTSPPHDGVVRIGSESNGFFTNNDYGEVIIKSLPSALVWKAANNLTNAIEMSMGRYFGVTVSNQ